MDESQNYQMLIAGIDYMYDHYIIMEINSKKIEYLFDIIYNNLIMDFEYFREYLIKNYNELEVVDLLNKINLEEQFQDEQYVIINKQLDIIDDYKKTMQLQLENMKQKYFLEILKTYPNLKYKSAYDLDIALKKKD